MSWDDDRKVAAFVTAKDPMVIAFSKNLMSTVKGKASPTLNEKVLTAMAIHEALILCGLTYTHDPAAAPAAARGQAVDYLQFPRQTLMFKAGDCDDLAILYCALLESLGIECAFITVPDHIYMAMSLGMNPDEARSTFSAAHAVDLLFVDGQTWLPIEVTEREGDFLAAWRTGAREWRESSLKDQARLLPVHEAWKEYEAAWLPGEEDPTMPGTTEFLQRYTAVVARFVEREIADQVKTLEEQIRKTKTNESLMNKLGVLYARYGMYDKAEAQLLAIVRTNSYVPALLNIGNIRFLKGDHEHALEYLERARAKDTSNAKILLALAQVNHAMENYGMATKLYQQVTDKDPTLARKFSYLGEKGEQGARAAEVSREKGAVAWSD
jgi:tetratricopeptide (TPR) repeat protein